MAIDISFRRPTADAVKVEDLLESVRRGEIRVPRFQRALKWRAHHVRALFDSILRGYPIGNLLFWRRSADAEDVRLGPVRIAAGPLTKASWVVDGQQRVTSLAAVLLRDDDAGDDPFALWFDLDQSELRSRDDPRPPDARWLPLRVLGDLERLLVWMQTEPSEERRRLAQRLAKAIREYQVPTYTVDTDDEQVAREIFDRMNTSGASMEAPDVFNALHGGSGPAPGDLRDVARRLRDQRFGEWEQRWLLKAVAAVAGKDLSRGLDELVRTHRDLGDALPRTEVALSRVIAFLREDAGIPHLRLLPYRLPLLVLARFFDRFPEPQPRTRVLLSRWLWRGAVSGVHADNAAPRRRDVVNAVDGDQHTAVGRLLEDLGALSDARNMNAQELARNLLAGGWNAKAAGSRIAAQAFLALHPRDLRSGVPLDVAEVLGAWGPEAFPAIARDFAAGACDRILHPPFPDLRRKLSEIQDETILSSHGFTLTPGMPATSGPSLLRRSELLCRRLAEVMERRLGGSDTDRPALQSLRVSDDEGEP